MDYSKKPLRVADVCRIITLCKESGVREVTLGDLHVSFGGEPKLFDKTVKEQDDIALMENKDNITQAYLDELLITDPATYEKLMNQGDIVDARNDDSEAE